MILLSVNCLNTSYFKEQGNLTGAMWQTWTFALEAETWCDIHPWQLISSQSQGIHCLCDCPSIYGVGRNNYYVLKLCSETVNLLYYTSCYYSKPSRFFLSLTPSRYFFKHHLCTKYLKEQHYVPVWLMQALVLYA